VTDTVQKTRVLFVDDEPFILQGLQRMLRPMRNEWEMLFVESGLKALDVMGEHQCEVVVTDMRMPGMNGAQLLFEVKERFPRTVRLILSGHADKDLILKCVGTAHQFLSKPCEPETLRSAILRASAFENSVKSDTIKNLIGEMDCLPSIPSVFNEIIENLQKEDTSVDEIGQIIAKDLAMTAKLLKLVNSAFFGLRRQVSSPIDAVTYLGVDTIKSLVLAVNAFSSFDGRTTDLISFTGLWTHSLEVADWSKRIAIDEGVHKSVAEESFIAGMLHDIGKLAFAANLPQEYEKAAKRAEEEQLPLYEAEDREFGANHADVGGYLLNLWGLPTEVVEAISSHHNPRNLEPALELSPLLALHVANGLSHENSGNAVFDEEFLKSHGATHKLEHWRSLTKTVQTQSTEVN
jgi:putative nucleotidyltransferase with HDIG domain